MKMFFSLKKRTPEERDQVIINKLLKTKESAFLKASFCSHQKDQHTRLSTSAQPLRPYRSIALEST